MSNLRQFFISLGVLVASTAACLGFVLVSFAFFTYQGNGMDWIYPAGGLAVIAFVGSGFSTAVTGTKMLHDYLSKKRMKRIST